MTFFIPFLIGAVLGAAAILLIRRNNAAKVDTAVDQAVAKANELRRE